MEIIKPSSKALNEAVLFLKKGGVVICPTDTVYGFLADAQNKKAVAKIFKIKNRPKSKPLSLFVKDFKMAESLAEVDGRQAKILTLRLRSGQGKFWPGKYTFVLKRKAGATLYGVDKKTIALRIPNYKFLNSVLKKINSPLAQTSVNISGQAPIENVKDILEKFTKQDILFINGGDLKKSKPSHMLDLTTEKLTKLR